MKRSYYILTIRGDVGPVDVDRMRELLSEGVIQPTDQVRTAFGKMLGSVSENLARGSGPQRSPVGSDQGPIYSARPRLLGRSTAAIIGLVILVGIVATFAMRESPQNANRQPAPPQPSAPFTPSIPSDQPATSATTPQPAKIESHQERPIAPVTRPKPPVPVTTQPLPTSSQTTATNQTPVTAPNTCTLIASGDNLWTIFFNGTQVATGDSWQNASVVSGLTLRQGTNVLATKVQNVKYAAGFLFEIHIGNKTLVSDANTRAISTAPTGWEFLHFDDSSWITASIVKSSIRASVMKHIQGIDAKSTAEWIWSHPNDAKDNEVAFFRFTFEYPISEPKSIKP